MLIATPGAILNCEHDRKSEVYILCDDVGHITEDAVVAYLDDNCPYEVEHEGYALCEVIVASRTMKTFRVVAKVPPGGCGADCTGKLVSRVWAVTLHGNALEPGKYLYGTVEVNSTYDY